MATSAFSATIAPLLPLCNSSSTSKPKFSSISTHHNAPALCSLKFNSTTRVFAAPELVDSEESLELPIEAMGGPEPITIEGDGPEARATSRIAVGSDVDKKRNLQESDMSPKQKIRIKLRSYWVPLIEDSCKQIMDAARTTNAKTMGPVPLPTKKRVYCVLKSPHVHKDARFHFEIRTHQRLIDIVYPTAQTIDALMQLDLPAGVDVEVKL
ncbi:hypothetical protein Syun_009576 [Stephania yunnanensis]|uniref:Small ribosomal subunit protein uS10c n=1 Tax=Stephania yunnanensis TaxID=152371 RepID=A0AAP0PP58_9MAGN